MAGKLWRKVWTALNTEIPVPWDSAVKGGAEGGKAVLELAKALNEKKAVEEFGLFIARFDSLLDVLNSPIAQVAGAALPFLPIATGILTYISKSVQPEMTLEESVILVSQAAYLESLRQFLGEHPEIKARLGDAKASAAVAERIKRLGERLDAEDMTDGMGFDNRHARDTLLCFHASPLAGEFNAVLAARLQEAGLAEAEAQTVTERVSRHTHRYLKEAVAEVRDKAKVLAAFYLKCIEGADNSVEFFHKSFGEFLCAQRMAETLADWTQKTGNRRKTYAIDGKPMPSTRKPSTRKCMTCWGTGF